MCRERAAAGRGQPAGPSDVAGLTADRVDIAEDDVFDSIRVDARAFEQGRDAGGTKIGGVDECESATSLSGGSADSVDDVSPVMATVWPISNGRPKIGPERTPRQAGRL